VSRTEHIPGGWSRTLDQTRRGNPRVLFHHESWPDEQLDEIVFFADGHFVVTTDKQQYKPLPATDKMPRPGLRRLWFW